MKRRWKRSDMPNLLGKTGCVPKRRRLRDWEIAVVYSVLKGLSECLSRPDMVSVEAWYGACSGLVWWVMRAGLWVLTVGYGDCRHGYHESL